jgi:hypothetical protein
VKKKCTGVAGYCFLILLVLLACRPAAAQYTDSLGGSWNNPASAMITNIIMDRYARRRLEKNLAARHSGASSTSSASANSAVHSNEASLHFRSTGTELKTREIAKVIDASNPQIPAIMTTILREYEKGARAAGKPNDLALALSFFFATNASVYHDAGMPADAPVMDLRETIASALVESDAFNGINDRQKQEMYETLVLVTGFALAAYQEGKDSGNSESVRIGEQLAGQNLQAVTGISPDKINFTNQGLSIEREPAASTPTAMQPAAEPVSPQEATATVNAGKLVIDFEGNEVRANQMYVGKRIRVSGTVNSIDILKDGRLTLTFHSPAAGYAHTRCFFNKSQSSRLAEMRGGQEVVVEGTVRGFGDDLKRYVEMENCIVP